MSIRGNVGVGTVAVLAGDTTLYDPPATVERYAISALSLHNTTAAPVTVTLYNSPNLTSASGVRNAQYAIPANQSVDVVELIGQGFTTRNIIAVGSGVGVNATMSVTTYDGGD
jgi:hypothetical protein